MAAVSQPDEPLSAKPSQTSVPPAQQPQAFSTAATFGLKLRGYDIFETYPLSCHGNGEKSMKYWSEL